MEHGKSCIVILNYIHIKLYFTWIFSQKSDPGILFLVTFQTNFIQLENLQLLKLGWVILEKQEQATLNDTPPPIGSSHQSHAPMCPRSPCVHAALPGAGTRTVASGPPTARRAPFRGPEEEGESGKRVPGQRSDTLRGSASDPEPAPPR